MAHRTAAPADAGGRIVTAAMRLPITDLKVGALLMMGAVSTFAFLDSFAKLAGQRVAVFDVIWMRFLVQFALSAVIFNPVRHPGAWRVNRKGPQILRALIQIFATGLNFAALGYLQITQTLSIQFSTPIFVTLLSIVFLGERVGRHRWLGIVLGLLGVLVVTRPGMEGFHWAFLLSLAGVVIGSGYNILTRMLSTTETSSSMLLMMSAVPALVLAPLAPAFWHMPEDAGTWALLIGTGCFGTLGHYLMILAHRSAPASFLAPFQYVQFLAVLVLGFAIFGSVPDGYTYLGALIVIGSGIHIWRRERLLGRRNAAALATGDIP
ncbi:DMT family transporter [Falsirhodobacter algicola]|uniref:EamA family transporter n=1 Tax=Falsirhodobacter algicola TaxID=2692330 RepID=A0A8J8MVN0_9RHOB|nr:DMT family transporter [Falsirhodobacter algicola]QUS37264.1 EamA family transporter [Falsirhodobacter algicola]